MPIIQAVGIGLIALILTPGLFFSFDVTPKLVLLLLVAAVSTVGARPAPRTLFTLLLALSAVSLAVSTALSPNPALSLFGSNWRRFGAITQAAVLLLAWLLSAQARRILAMLGIVVAAGTLIAAYGIAQYFGWDPILPAAAYHVGEGIWSIVRPPSTLGHAAYFATWMLFVVFLSLAAPGRIYRIAAAIGVAAILLTGTRAAMLGLAAGAAVWMYWRGLRVSRRVLALALAGACAIAVFYFSPAGWQLRSRARWFAEDPWGGARPLLWRDSLRMALGRLAAGHGPETFTGAFPHYQSAELARAYPDFAHESPHNMFLDALVAQGIPGMLLLAGLCALGFRAAWALRGRRPEAAASLAAALAAGIAAQQFTVFTIPTAVIFFATIALAVGLEAPATQPARLSPAAMAVAMAVAVPLLYFAARFAFADHSLALSQRRLAAGDLAAATRYFAGSRMPGASNDLWYSRALIQAAQKLPSAAGRMQALGESLAAGIRATTTTEDPFNAWYSLSALYASQNDARQIEYCLRQAIRASPTWFKPHWTLARVLAVGGRIDEAESEAVQAAWLDGGKHPEVARTVEEVRAQLHE